MTRIESDRILYLAIPLEAYQTFFQLAFSQTAIQEYQLLLIVYDSINEEIIQWIK